MCGCWLFSKIFSVANEYLNKINTGWIRKSTYGMSYSYCIFVDSIELDLWRKNPRKAENNLEMKHDIVSGFKATDHWFITEDYDYAFCLHTCHLIYIISHTHTLKHLHLIVSSIFINS